MDEMVIAADAALPRLLTVDEVAAMWSVSSRHVRGLIARHVLPSVQIGRSRRVQRAIAEKVVREGLPTE